jgi:hypothetical protein
MILYELQLDNGCTRKLESKAFHSYIGHILLIHSRVLLVLFVEKTLSLSM